MGESLPPDPYLALGVPKDAAAGTIKTTYRKLVLKFHPDKVQDEAQKELASDQFHRIQTAYEIIGDEDRRARYDAQCKLAELRKDVMDRQHGPAGTRSAEPRSPARTPADSPRASYFYDNRPTDRSEKVAPVYEERRPTGYTSNDYFDAPPRSTARKDPQYERSTKRTSARGDTKERERTAKKTQRASRDERSRRTDRDIRRDRDRKSSNAYVEDMASSDSDRYEARSRRVRDEDAELRRARDSFYERAPRSKEDTSYANYDSYDSGDRSHKLYSQTDTAREYMERSRRDKKPSSVRGSSPERQTSLKDKLAYFAGGATRPSATRRDSARSKTAPRAERRSSGDIVEEPRRPPTLNQTKSSPADIRIPTVEKQRSQSVQLEADDLKDFVPKFRRADTMPTPRGRERARESQTESRRKEFNQPPKSSGLRQTEFPEGLATPSTTPEYAEPPSNRFSRYGKQYADDGEYPTPEGYRTELREPSVPNRPSRYTRSPSPNRESRESRDSRTRSDRFEREPTPRTTSTRYNPDSPVRASMPRTTSHSYVYTPSSGLESYTRPSLSRENSTRSAAAADLLYGEVRSSRSPKQPYNRYSPPQSPEASSPRYQREFKPEDLRPQTGYNYMRRPDARPSYTRSGSNPVYV